MGIVSPGFHGRRRPGAENLPPGQYLVTDFPVLSAGPTPRVDLAKWELRVAQTRVYPDAPGLVARCPGCGEIMLRLARGRGRAWLDLRGITCLRLALPGQP